MVKNYYFLFFLIFGPICLLSQEIKIFTTADFDLKGKVKTCLVSTNYGKEEYDFNEQGLLTRAVTRYNDTDYDIALYKYANGELLEKRFENYRNNVFDSITSIANFYQIGTISKRKVIERIMTYTKEFLGQNVYSYDDKGRLTKIESADTDGIDETTISHTDGKGEKTTTYKLNGTIQKSVRTLTEVKNNSFAQKTLSTKTFLNGIPDRAVEEVYDSNNKLVKQTKYVYDDRTKELVSSEILVLTYDNLGMLSKTEIKNKPLTEVKEYIYQLDDGLSGNWIKEIITPDNTYTTRNISYYKNEQDGDAEKN